MKKIMMSSLSIFILAFTLGAKTTINKSIHIAEGERHSGGCSSVNGSIIVEEGAEIKGGCKTVNGSIKIANDCKVRRLQSVNGAIRIGQNSEIHSDVETVNGSIHCKEGVYIDGNIETVNGSVKLRGAEVEDKITTYNGSITLTQKSIVHDDIIIKNNKGHNDRKEPLLITIDNSVVDGDVINKEEDIEVIVHLRNGGRVKGEIYDCQIKED